MRKIVLTSLLAAVLAATVTTTGCNKGDPNALETHVQKLDDAEARGDAIKQLERIVSGIAADPADARRAEFAEKVVPKLAEIYDATETAPYRDSILDMALKMERPEASVIWAKAVAVDSGSGIDGSAEGHKRAITALQGIRAANATANAVDVVTAFTTLQEKPSKDMGTGQEGALRYEMAKTLGAIKAKEGVAPLIAALQAKESDQPKGIYKAAIDALGQIGDPAAVDALITVQFSVADSPGTQSIPERAVRALGAIGEGAVPKLIETMEGNNEAVNALAAKNDLDVQVVQQSAVRSLGVVGSTKATKEILAYMPQRDCGGDEVIDPATLEGTSTSTAPRCCEPSPRTPRVHQGPRRRREAVHVSQRDPQPRGPVGDHLGARSHRRRRRLQRAWRRSSRRPLRGHMPSPKRPGKSPKRLQVRGPAGWARAGWSSRPRPPRPARSRP